jgi:hypothetical protein
LNYIDCLIEFYTPSGVWVDCINTKALMPYAIQFKITDEKLWGLKKFEIKIQRNIDIRLFNQMLVKFWINSNHWFTGYIDFLPVYDQTDKTIELEGYGFARQLDKNALLQIVYNNEDVSDIIDDIFTNQINGMTDILYNAANINLPAKILTTLEANDKQAANVIESILEACNSNFDTTEYTAWIAPDRYIYIDEVEKINIIRNFFEGYDYQDTKPKLKSDKLTNKINIYKTAAGSQTVSYDSTVSDADSIAKYDEKIQKLTIPSNMDSTTGQDIANYKISRWKDPKKTLQVKDLQIEDEPFPFGSYGITSRHQDNTIVIDECNALTDWNYNLPGSSLTIDKTKVFSGRNAFRWEVTAYNTDYIEYELDEPLWFWESLTFWISPETDNCEYQVYIEDKDGNSLNSDYFICETYDVNPDYLILENGVDYFTTNSTRSVWRNIVISVVHDNRNIALENEDLFVLENGVDELVIDGYRTSLNVLVIGDYNPMRIYNENQLTNIKKFKLANVGNGTTSYLDRLEISGRIFLTSKLTLEKITYSSNANQILADADFGEIEENAIDKIKEINKKQANIFSIFEKQ